MLNGFPFFGRNGIGVSSFGAVGMILAGALSWGLYQSVLWTIIHGIFGWFYVIFYVLTQGV
jgi:hypothetical protein